MRQCKKQCEGALSIRDVTFSIYIGSAECIIILHINNIYSRYLVIPNDDGKTPTAIKY